ncbi:class I SAM-dependent methyltransferase [Amycolatopsis sp. CA-230715]|uniref:class I SAM-dependent methyltransferase n=1 Tax=Amycolatopsis sp. CA-230715 TaxID=2745196 RepID=UPI001C0371FF|nr:class I SAM-dependent methyltransferase [Amycolatopsis sp. CA-230715]QWF81448.1 putative methyltransferase [Amycolatopsis sp. CA-230715]
MPDSAELRTERSRSFGAEAAAYAEHRPDYPVEALAWGLPEGDRGRIIDLAAGTGKLTGNLLSLGDVTVVAVEPDDQMRAELSKRLPAVKAYPGTAERIPLPDDSADAVFAGQAFHWFDVDSALTEIARILRPGGTVTALWNHDDESVPWVAAFSALVRTGVSRGWADEDRPLPGHPAFHPFERARFSHSQRRTAETLTATVATHSRFLVTAEAERAAALAKVREFLRTTPETAVGEFELPLVTTVIRAVRR